MDVVTDLIAILENHKLIGSVVFILIVILIRELLIKVVRKRAKRKQKDRRSTVSTIRNLTNFIMFIMIFIIWSVEIQSFALSIAAFTVAIILATREYVQCLLGFVYISSTRSFSVGDWIQVDNSIGEVANRDWLKVNLLEVDQTDYGYTGKSLSIPNNRFITQSIKNLNYLRRYASHTFEITVPAEFDIFPFRDAIMKKAEEYCEPFHEVAQRYSVLIEKRLEVTISGPEPYVQILTNEYGNVIMAITIFCPTELAIEIEQKLTRDFMGMWFKKNEA
ncbi:mechanosensitive ion channel family protein [Pleionea sediminis]|uniref:mechanosensitive ion channel family protein n=1 Tax=Pleionea sediminis TaxID=2569479 RepID=UPI0011856D3E|nr:mechanosensitive ion channel family protein [Pleionea sediminis]